MNDERKSESTESPGGTASGGPTAAAASGTSSAKIGSRPETAISEFEKGRRHGLREAADLISGHHETISNQPPFRYLSPRRHTADMTNIAFIEKLREMANG